MSEKPEVLSPKEFEELKALLRKQAEEHAARGTCEPEHKSGVNVPALRPRKSSRKSR